MNHDYKETLDAKFSEDASGERINNYIISKLLGSGSFGSVHLGVDTDHGDRQVAIKRFSKSRLRKQHAINNGTLFGGARGRGRQTLSKPQPQVSSVDLIKSEIAILKKLKHKNIVRLYEVLDDPNQVC